jgi:tripartite-type tricarboxylate transporter receptor subunit TctC
MMHRFTRIALHTAALTWLSLAIGHSIALAQPWPNKPIKLIIPFPPGGTTDIVGRAVVDQLSKQLGQPIVIENRGGAAGAIGAEAIAKAAPDGYTIGLATVSTHGTNPTMNPKLAYDVERDFIAITNLADVPNILAIHPTVPAQNMAELLALLRAKPGQLSYASSGTGGIGHMFGELFKVSSKTFILHIPYRGAGPALNDAIGGQVNMIFDNLPSTLPFVQAGKLRPIAVASTKRVDVLPNVPTFAELGLKDANVMAWYGLVAPARTPDDVVKKIYDGALKALQSTEVRERFKNAGATPIGNTPQEYAKQIKSEMETWRRVVKLQGIKPE